MLRVLDWHLQEGQVGHGRQGPTYYMEQDYSPVSMQIYAENAPDGGDLQVDVLNDGTSILNAYARLPEDANEEPMAEDFKDNVVLNTGSWVYMNVATLANAKNVTVQLVLETLSQEEDIEE